MENFHLHYIKKFISNKYLTVPRLRHNVTMQNIGKSLVLLLREPFREINLSFTGIISLRKVYYCKSSFLYWNQGIHFFLYYNTMYPLLQNFLLFHTIYGINFYHIKIDVHTRKFFDYFKVTVDEIFFSIWKFIRFPLNIDTIFLKWDTVRETGVKECSFETLNMMEFCNKEILKYIAMCFKIF